MDFRSNPQHTHLRRLAEVWLDVPVFFITVCTAGRLPILANEQTSAVFGEVWRKAETLYGWKTGAYVVMPDHVHFFCSGDTVAKPLRVFIGKWKEWTAKNLKRQYGVSTPLWQPEFFDHVLRSDESYSQKWEYVRQNPVRAGLVLKPEEWPYWGMIHQL